MKKKNLFSVLIIVLFFLLAGCGSNAKSLGEVTISSGTFTIVKVETSDRFPPDCETGSGMCQQAKPGYQILVVWLEPQGDVDAMTRAIEVQKEATSATVTAANGSKSSGVGGGMYKSEWFILFTPPAADSDFTLEWLDNPAIPLGK